MRHSDRTNRRTAQRALLRTFCVSAALLLAVFTLCTGCGVGPGTPLDLGPEVHDMAGLLLAGAFVVMAYRLVSRKTGRDKAAVSITPAESIVRERYARGEITQEEFADRMRTLQQS